MKRSFFIAGLIFCAKAFSLEFAIDSSRSFSDTEITEYKIFSERCSGSNYLKELMNKNFPKIRSDKRFGHKHFSPWFNRVDAYSGPEENWTFADSGSTLFIIIFRDPYDWLRSLRNHPFHSTRNLHNLLFSKFIRTQWTLTKKELLELHKIHKLLDLDPATSRPFKNVMHLRSAKIRNMLEIPKKVKHYYLINYEVLEENPEGVLDEIAELFCLERNKDFEDEQYNRGWKHWGKYKKTKYPPIAIKDVQFINQQLDWDLERSIGYEPRQTVR